MDQPSRTASAQRLAGRLSRRVTLNGLAAGVTAAALRSGPPAAHSAAARSQETPAVPATPGPAAGPGVLPGLSGVTPLRLAGERLAAFEAYVAAKLAAQGVPGAAVAVVQDGEVVFLQGFGVRELSRPEPVTADTLLRIGSVTKSFSSLLTATLVDAGRLSWNTPLGELLPDFAVAGPSLTSRLTMADAFCACSGLPRRDWEFQFQAQDLTPERMIAEMARLPLTAPYGERYQYSNQMVAAGGFAAAVADGGSPHDLGHAYAIALRERVLNPIAMPRTTDVLADVVADNDYATPHAADIAGVVHPLPLMVDDTWIVPVAPAGDLWSSVREMARYVQTELGHGVAPNGVRVVSAENLEQTWQPGVPTPAVSGTPPLLAAFGQHYALGWAVGEYGGQRAIWHAGGTFGFNALVTFLPEAQLGVVVLTNAAPGTAGPVTIGVTFRLLELVYDQPATFDAEFAPGLAVAAQGRVDLLGHLGEVDPTAVAPYLGRYANPDLGRMTLALRAGKLVVDSGAFRAELRPQLGADGTVVAYLPVDPPLAGFPPQMTFALERDATGGPRLVLTIPADPGEADLVYPFVPIGLAAAPAP